MAGPAQSAKRGRPYPPSLRASGWQSRRLVTNFQPNVGPLCPERTFLERHGRPVQGDGRDAGAEVRDLRNVNARINLVNLGDAQILTIPGEALPNIGFYLKRKMRGKNNLLFGLTNEAFGYILTKVDFHSFPRYDYVSRTSLGEMTGEILIEKSLELVNKSRHRDR